MIDTPTPSPELRVDAQRFETGALISSEKVEGTAVYDTAGTWLGSIQSVMIDKRSGQVAYAVMSFGGFLGLGQKFFPVPWSQLRYDMTRAGYVVDLTERQLSDAPYYDARNSWNDPAFRDRLDHYYGPSVEAEWSRTGGSI